MGCASSRETLYKLEPDMNKWHEQFNGIGLSDDDILKIRSKRDEIKNSGNISEKDKLTIRVLLDYFDPDLCKKPLMYKIFASFKDGDPNGEIDDLREFVFGLWNICTIDFGSLDAFLFSLYRGQSELLGSKELVALVKETFGNKFKDDEDNLKLIIEIQSKGLSSTLEEFKTFVHEHPSLANEVMEVSTLIQTHAFGVAYWKKRTLQRTSLPPDKIFSVFAAVNPRIYWVGMSKEQQSKELTLRKGKDNKERSSRRTFHQPKIAPTPHAHLAPIPSPSGNQSATIP